MTQKEHFLNIIEDSPKILVTSHLGADGDAIGATLATKRWLELNYPSKLITAAVPGKAGNTWNAWEGIEKLEWVEEISDQFESHDLVIFLDVDEIHMISTSEFFSLKGIKSIIIDHHGGDGISADLIIRDSNAVSTTQILADVLFDDETINHEIAKDLLLGILFDSGKLRYVELRNVDSLLTVKRLIEYLKTEQLEDLISPFETILEDEFEITKELTKNTVNIKEIKLTLSYVEMEDYDHQGLKRARSFYISRTLKKISGYPWGVVVTKKKGNEYSLTFRSKFQTVDVAKLTEAMFTGGGHPGAAGGVYFADTEDKDTVIEEIVELIKNYLDKTGELK